MSFAHSASTSARLLADMSMASSASASVLSPAPMVGRMCEAIGCPGVVPAGATRLTTITSTR